MSNTATTGDKKPTFMTKKLRSNQKIHIKVELTILNTELTLTSENIVN